MTAALAPYAAVASGRFRMLLQYRAAAAAGIATQLFFGFVRVMIYEAFYRSATEPPPLALDEVVGYVWLGQALLLLVMLTADPEIAESIRSGGVAHELTRPLDLHALWYSRCFSGRAASLLLRAPPILLVAALFLGLEPPSLRAAGLFAMSFALALALASAIVTLLSVTLLWTVSGDGVNRITMGLVFVLSGIVIPLPLLPAWAQPVIEALPFRGLMDVPVRIWLGDLSGSVAALALLQQAAWLVFFVMLGRWVLARGVRRLVVQGG